MGKSAGRHAALTAFASVVAVICLLLVGTLRVGVGRPTVEQGGEDRPAAVGAGHGGAVDFAREPEGDPVPTEVREGEAESDRAECAIDPWHLGVQDGPVPHASARARDRDANGRRAAHGAVVSHTGRGPPRA